MKMCDKEASVEVGAIVLPMADRKEAVALSHIGAASHPYNALVQAKVRTAFALAFISMGSLDIFLTSNVASWILLVMVSAYLLWPVQICDPRSLQSITTFMVSLMTGHLCCANPCSCWFAGAEDSRCLSCDWAPISIRYW